MNPQAAQLQLRDIHLPDSISLWPLAPGWWLVLGLLILLGIVSYLTYRFHQQRKVHRAARKELEKIQALYASNTDSQQLVMAVSIWLRRVCLSCFPRHDVAGLTGPDWLNFLDTIFIQKNHPDRFNDDKGAILLSAPYQQSVELDTEHLLSLCHHWLTCLPRQGGWLR